MEDKIKIDSKPLDIVVMNIYLYGEADPDCPRISPEMREKISAWMPKPDKALGRVMLCGTGSDLDKGDFRELWDAPVNYKIYPL